jgi:hypothetical protein
VTVCNQNRVHCQKLKERKKFCEEYKNGSHLENNNQTLSNNSMDIPETSANYTICDKMSVTEENVSVIEYLFHEGKCGEICSDGKVYYYCYLI